MVGIVGDHRFVGRQDLLRELVRPGPQLTASIHHIVGVSGSGKSSVLAKVGESLSGHGFVVANISCSRVAVMSTAGELDRVGLARGILTRCVEILRLVADDLNRSSAAARTAAERLLEVVRHAVRLTDLQRIDPTDRAGPVTEPAPWLGEITAGLLHDVRDVLSGLEQLAPDGAGLAVLIDEFDAIEDTGVGDWLLELLDALPGSVRVLARRPSQRPINGVRHELPALTRDEVAAYLREPALPADRLDEIMTVTGGLPLLVAIVAELDARFGGDTDLAAAFGDTGESLVERVAANRDLDAMCDELERLLEWWWSGPTENPRLLDRLCVVRQIDQPLLAALLGDEDQPADEVATAELWEVLRRRSFVIGFDDDTDAGIRLHEAVRAARERQSHARDPAFHQRMHRQAERHFQTQMEAFEDDERADDQQFTAWFRYEDPRWQRLTTLWLFHTARSGRKPHHVRIAFALIYFEAFWWMGEMVPFPFCDRILTEFASMPGSDTPENRAWLAHLRQFDDSFQRNLLRDRDDQELWARVAESLDYLLARVDHGAAPPRDRHGWRMLRGYLLVYRAEAARYTGDPLTELDVLYWQAAEAFSADPTGDPGDEWCLLWTEFTQVDAWQERGAWKQALARVVPELIERIEEQEEYELRVWLALMVGDIRWQQKEYGSALDAYARAVLHSYVYNIRQEHLDQQPSDYTRALYERTVDNLGDRLTKLRDLGEDDIRVAALDRIIRLFRPYWRLLRDTGRPLPAVVPRSGAELRDHDSALFFRWKLRGGHDGEQPPPGIVPPPPSIADIATTNSQYAQDVREMLKQRRIELDEEKVIDPLEAD